MDKANAFPKKQFFLDLFTRDISLEDCILDLVDNSVDSVLKVKNVDIAKRVLVPKAVAETSRTRKPQITIQYSQRQFQITDSCGGIPYDAARDEVFCFGPVADDHGGLAVYGVGLKRAIFKLGKSVFVESHTTQDGFRMEENLASWAERDQSLEDWKFPLERLQGVARGEAGTTVRVRDLNEGAVTRFKDPTLERALTTLIARTYAVFLGAQVELKLNGQNVNAQPLPFGRSPHIEPGEEKFREDDVDVWLLATLAPRPWSQEVAGWYVLCNGRMVVYADKSDLTGWGVTLPTFHSKYRGFVGLALFTSTKALKLPWNTSKRGVNRESLIYQHARARMAGVARPVLNFLNRMYPAELEEQPAEREAASDVHLQDFRAELRASGPRTFKARTRRAQPTGVNIKYQAEPAEIERVRKKVRQPKMTPSAIGRHTFDHFLNTECPE